MNTTEFDAFSPKFVVKQEVLCVPRLYLLSDEERTMPMVLYPEDFENTLIDSNITQFIIESNGLGPKDDLECKLDYKFIHTFTEETESQAEGNRYKVSDNVWARQPIDTPELGAFEINLDPDGYQTTIVALANDENEQKFNLTFVISICGKIWYDESVCLRLRPE